MFLPAPEARAVFDQINEVYGKIEGLETRDRQPELGQAGELAFGSAPSVAQFIVARAVSRSAGGSPSSTSTSTC